MDIFSKITEQIDYYKDHIDKMTLPTLINLKEKMAINAFYLAGEIAELKKDYNQKYFIRKLSISKTQQALINSGSAIGKSKIDADVENELPIKEELEAEYNAIKGDLLLKGVYKVIDALSQRIAYERKEQETHIN